MTDNSNNSKPLHESENLEEFIAALDSVKVTNMALAWEQDTRTLLQTLAHLKLGALHNACPKELPKLLIDPVIGIMNVTTAGLIDILEAKNFEEFDIAVKHVIKAQEEFVKSVKFDSRPKS